jgi:hypothetical protein
METDDRIRRVLEETVQAAASWHAAARLMVSAEQQQEWADRIYRVLDQLGEVTRMDGGTDDERLLAILMLLEPRIIEATTDLLDLGIVEPS